MSNRRKSYRKWYTRWADSSSPASCPDACLKHPVCSNGAVTNASEVKKIFNNLLIKTNNISALTCNNHHVLSSRGGCSAGMLDVSFCDHHRPSPRFDLAAWFNSYVPLSLHGIMLRPLNFFDLWILCITERSKMITTCPWIQANLFGYRELYHDCRLAAEMVNRLDLWAANSYLT